MSWKITTLEAKSHQLKMQAVSYFKNNIKHHPFVNVTFTDEPTERHKSYDSERVLYAFIEESLRKNEDLRKYQRRIECIMLSLKASDTAQELTPTFSHDIEKGTVEVVNKEQVLEQAQETIDTANFHCLLPGITSVVILGSVLVIVISLVVCLSKGDPRPDIV